MRRDLHAEVTQRLLAALRSADGGDWRPPWISMAATGLPRNAATGARYRGINIVNLWAEAQLRGFGAARWATYRQWAALGAQVRRGERASRVVFYKTLCRHEPPAEEEGEPVERRVPVLRTSAVFNASQVSGYEDPEAARPPAGEAKRVAACEAFVAATGAEIRPNAGRAFYDPVADYVGLRPTSSFAPPRGATRRRSTS